MNLEWVVVEIVCPKRPHALDLFPQKCNNTGLASGMSYVFMRQCPNEGKFAAAKRSYNIAHALVLSHSVYVSVLKIQIVPADSVSKLLRQKCFVFRASGHC